MQSADLLVLTTLIGNAIGWFIKNKTSWQNRIIPYVQVVLALGKNLLVSAGVLPVGVTVLSALGMSTTSPEGYTFAGLQVIAWFILGILFDAALPIGVHSMFKNMRQQHESRVAKKKK